MPDRLKVIVWNLERLTEEKARTFSKTIGSCVKGVVGDKTPYLFVVLENKTKPLPTLDAICAGLPGVTSSIAVELGGSSSTKENALVITGNGATATIDVFEGWREAFRKASEELKSHEKAQQTQFNAAIPYKLRTPGGVPRSERSMDRIEGSFTPVEALRNPVSITAHYGGCQPISLLSLHAPGPSVGKEHDETTAATYAKCVLESAGDRFDIVAGDFNLRKEISDQGRVGAFVDQSVGTGATTKGEDLAGRDHYSRLDRIYAKPGLPVRAGMASDSLDSKELTDHHALVVTLEEERQQRVLTDYFALANPGRRQGIQVVDSKEVSNDDEGLAPPPEKKRH